MTTGRMAIAVLTAGALAAGGSALSLARRRTLN